MLMLGLGLNFFTPSEVVASVIVSSILVLALGVLLTIVFLIWQALKSVARWAKVSSRNSARTISAS